MADKVRKAVDPITDASGGWIAPTLDWGLRFQDYHSKSAPSRLLRMIRKKAEQ
jgi:hypothetical protein